VNSAAAPRGKPLRQEPAGLSAMDRLIAQPRLRTRTLVIATATLLAAVAGITLYVRLSLTRTLTIDADHVVVSSVELGTFHDYVPATGTVVPRDIAYIDAVEGGQVEAVLAEEGALVSAGQPLVRLKNTSLRMEVLGRESQLLEQLERLDAELLAFQQSRLEHQRALVDSRAQIETGARLLARRQALKAAGLIPAADLENSETELQRLRGQRSALLEARSLDEKFENSQVAGAAQAIATIRRNLSMMGASLEALTVRAPFAGRLTSLEAQLGESKLPGQRIGQIDGTATYQIEAALDEFYLQRVAVGQPGMAPIDGRDYRLHIAKTYSQVLNREFKVDLWFDDPPPNGLRRGQTLQLRLGAGESDRRLLLGNGEFLNTTGGTWAFVLVPESDTAVRRTIRIGHRSPDTVEVLSGLARGERVITSGYDGFTDFDRIRLRH
jgi:HlyD family secretion protein